jgi:hypothetical protein
MIKLNANHIKSMVEKVSAYKIGWFTETHFVEFPCYPSKIIIIKVQITTVKSFEAIGDDLDIAIVLQNFHSQITRV